MLVIDPTGMVVRVMAAPRPQDLLALLGGAAGDAGVDSHGRPVYRNQFNFVRTVDSSGTPAPP